MSTIIQVEIKDCQDCPFCKEKRHWTPDPWEHAYNYYCSNVAKVNGDYKKIAGYIEWRHEMPEVPDWCPIRVK